MNENTPIPKGKYVRTPSGLDIHYQDSGVGETVVFIHGSGPGASGYSNFKGNYPVFANEGFRVLVPDLPGYGLSSKPDDVEYVLDYFVGVLREFLDALDVTRCVLVGNSLGGAIALKYALDRPEAVQRLILMGPGGLEEREVYFQMEGIQRMMSDFATGVLDREGMRRLLSILVYDPVHVTDELLDERVPVCEMQPKSVLATMRVPNLVERLHEIRCPVLGFWGSDDKFCPASGALKVLERCADTRFVITNRCGHWVMVEHRDLFNKTCIEFLTTA
ncbi:alpha/beta fold hydrolase [Paraburkholderia sacchari]|uniref:alpha/beta fold hydrolase n=1 Tax=Paraburkholderia sacchari TaxID=159450 RepID=UPI000544499F|nr:alpha/beta hydrolase [Paraburkholderia sacchari]NLP64846.1 alpha/beta fold hydrolase [Paraburkholderia sacchari]